MNTMLQWSHIYLQQEENSMHSPHQCCPSPHSQLVHSSDDGVPYCMMTTLPTSCWSERIPALPFGSEMHKARGMPKNLWQRYLCEQKSTFSVQTTERHSLTKTCPVHAKATLTQWYEEGETMWDCISTICSTN
jgi:hypothetical protein